MPPRGVMRCPGRFNYRLDNFIMCHTSGPCNVRLHCATPVISGCACTTHPNITWESYPYTPRIERQVGHFRIDQDQSRSRKVQAFPCSCIWHARSTAVRVMAAESPWLRRVAKPGCRNKAVQVSVLQYAHWQNMVFTAPLKTARQQGIHPPCADHRHR